MSKPDKHVFYNHARNAEQRNEAMNDMEKAVEAAARARIVEDLWRPHLGALHTMVTAADYDGIRKLIASISLNIASAALPSRYVSGEVLGALEYAAGKLADLEYHWIGDKADLWGPIRATLAKARAGASPTAAADIRALSPTHGAVSWGWQQYVEHIIGRLEYAAMPDQNGTSGPLACLCKEAAQTIRAMLSAAPSPPAQGQETMEAREMLCEFIARQRAKLKTVAASASWRNGYIDALESIERVILELLPAAQGQEQPPRDVSAATKAVWQEMRNGCTDEPCLSLPCTCAELYAKAALASAPPAQGEWRNTLIEQCAHIAESYQRDASFDDSQVGAGEHNANQINIANAIRAFAAVTPIVAEKGTP